MSTKSIKVAMITGGGRGIGRAISLELASRGCLVGVTFRGRELEAQETVSQIRTAGGDAVAIQMELSERASIQGAVEACTGVFGAPDILVNNGAIAQEKPFHTITDEDWDQMMGVNLRGCFACSQEVLPAMQKKGWGRLIHITSIGGQWGGFNQVHYAAAKAGLISLARSLAKIYSAWGITSNAVAPGLVQTEMAQGELESDAGKEKVKNIPMGRIGRAQEIADVVAYLASEQASYITGQTMNPNGGMYFT